mmetsp:Transcript_1667/g.2731  ORF Transcript_1667/g.2731 Transcript_1667/m.2731 type:complete len:305 (-) Transcript_1667:88-1002(-)
MPRIKGAKRGEGLAAVFKGKSQSNFANGLKSTKVILFVSIVGNKYCSGAYLEASIANAIEKHGHTTMLLADQVYWNNLVSCEAMDIAIQQQLITSAIEIADEFIANNLPYVLRPLGIDEVEFRNQNGSRNIAEQIAKVNSLAKERGVNFEFVRWAEWVNGTEMKLAEVAKILDNNPEMQSSYEETAKEFALRHSAEAYPSLWLLRSNLYLREEVPAVVWLSVTRGYDFIVYPGDVVSPFEIATKLLMQHAKDLPGEAILLGQSNWLNIQFKRRLTSEQLLQQSMLEASSHRKVSRASEDTSGDV